MLNKSIIPLFREGLSEIQDESRREAWVVYLDAWELWVDHVNHTRSIIDKYTYLLMFLIPWVIYRDVQADKKLKVMNKLLGELNK